MALSKDELLEKYGEIKFHEWRDNHRVYVSWHDTEESAQAFLEANEEHYGHPGSIEKTSDGWLLLTDLGPAPYDAIRSNE